jgi:hypothetical protein
VDERDYFCRTIVEFNEIPSSAAPTACSQATCEPVPDRAF